MKRGLGLVFFSVLIAVAPEASLAKNLIQNASFETPRVPDGQKQDFTTGDSVGAWKVTAGTVSLVSTDYAADGFEFDARNSTQWMNLGSTGEKGATIEQTVSVTQGNGYLFSMFLGSVYDKNGSYGRKSKVKIRFLQGGGSILDFTAVNDHKQQQQWGPVSFLIYPGGKKLTIQITNLDADSDCGVDKVSLALY